MSDKCLVIVPSSEEEVELTTCECTAGLSKFGF